MIYQIVEAFKETALRHKGVFTFKYQDKILINAQPNNKYYEVIIETDPYFGQVGDNHTLTLNMDVLGFVDIDEVTTQDIACQIGLSIINKVVADNRMIMSLNNYSILCFTKNTDDVSAGARFTIELTVPSFIDFCTEPDNFLTDEEYQEKLENMKDSELNLGEPKDDKGLDLKPLKL